MSAGTAENHSHEFSAHGSRLLISAARIISVISGVAVVTDPVWLIDGPPRERARHPSDAPRERFKHAVVPVSALSASWPICRSNGPGT
jgi:hypothetical protein